MGDRLIQDYGKFVVIVPVDASPSVPLGCPVCDVLFRTREDEQSYQQWQCCERCAMMWAYPNQVAWNNGWRPTAEQIAVDLEVRPKLSISFDVD